MTRKRKLDFSTFTALTQGPLGLFFFFLDAPLGYHKSQETAGTVIQNLEFNLEIIWENQDESVFPVYRPGKNIVGINT